MSMVDETTNPQSLVVFFLSLSLFIQYCSQLYLLTARSQVLHENKSAFLIYDLSTNLWWERSVKNLFATKHILRCLLIHREERKTQNKKRVKVNRFDFVLADRFFFSISSLTVTRVIKFCNLQRLPLCLTVARNFVLYKLSFIVLRISLTFCFNSYSIRYFKFLAIVAGIFLNIVFSPPSINQAWAFRYTYESDCNEP